MSLPPHPLPSAAWRSVLGPGLQDKLGLPGPLYDGREEPSVSVPEECLVLRLPPSLCGLKGRPSNAPSWFPRLPGHQMELLPPSSLLGDQFPPSAAKAIRGSGRLWGGKETQVVARRLLENGERQPGHTLYRLWPLGRKDGNAFQLMN